MILLPAIDIQGGRAVRLVRGDFEQETIYADSPLEAARSFVEAGARALHVVDLDGARAGRPRSIPHLRAIVDELDVPVQYGGGLRSVEAVREAFDAGADRVVLGTQAYHEGPFLEAVLEEWWSRVFVAVDVRGGHVSVAGWTRGTGEAPTEVIQRMQDRGVAQFIYTSVDRDGTMEGLDVDEVLAAARAVQGRFVYSGGIASLRDLETLSALALPNLAGVISGKALYERRFTLAEGQAALDPA